MSNPEAAAAPIESKIEQYIAILKVTPIILKG